MMAECCRLTTTDYFGVNTSALFPQPVIWLHLPLSYAPSSLTSANYILSFTPSIHLPPSSASFC